MKRFVSGKFERTVAKPGPPVPILPHLPRAGRQLGDNDQRGALSDGGAGVRRAQVKRAGRRRRLESIPSPQLVRYYYYRYAFVTQRQLSLLITRFFFVVNRVNSSRLLLLSWLRISSLPHDFFSISL